MPIRLVLCGRAAAGRDDTAALLVKMRTAVVLWHPLTCRQRVGIGYAHPEPNLISKPFCAPVFRDGTGSGQKVDSLESLPRREAGRRRSVRPDRGLFSLTVTLSWRGLRSRVCMNAEQFLNARRSEARRSAHAQPTPEERPLKCPDPDDPIQNPARNRWQRSCRQSIMTTELFDSTIVGTTEQALDFIGPSPQRKMWVPASKTPRALEGQENRSSSFPDRQSQITNPKSQIP